MTYSPHRDLSFYRLPTLGLGRQHRLRRPHAGHLPPHRLSNLPVLIKHLPALLHSKVPLNMLLRYKRLPLHILIEDLPLRDRRRHRRHMNLIHHQIGHRVSVIRTHFPWPRPCVQRRLLRRIRNGWHILNRLLNYPILVSQKIFPLSSQLFLFQLKEFPFKTQYFLRSGFVQALIFYYDNVSVLVTGSWLVEVRLSDSWS